ncbi:MAG: uroporphyrinogen-III synthase [Burkholderiaceae bacterium]
MSDPAGAQPPQVVVTRPQPEADAWVRALQEHGWQAQAMPLIEIGEPTAAVAQAGLSEARANWLAYDALMFVSAAAVRHFFAGVSPVPPDRLPTTRFWAPGPGTARELERALSRWGVDGRQVDAPAADAPQFDSEHLWPQVQAQMGPGRRLLVVRGGGPEPVTEPDGVSGAVSGGQGREWLMQRCRELGAEVQSCMAYERRVPVFGPADCDRLRAATGPGHVWLLSSSEALANLDRILGGHAATGAAALATHPRIALAARAAGFVPVEMSRPALADVLAALESHWSCP